MHSKGEAKIQLLLDELHIKYQHEYALIDLLGPRQQPRRIDFAIFDNNHIKAFIEYQGEQHTDNNNNWYSGDADIEKRNYCKKQNIPLIEIQYTDYNKLNKEYLLDLLNF